jgi:putative transposase
VHFGEIEARSADLSKVDKTRAEHAFGERAVLKLMYAALIRAAERWRGLRMTEFERRQLIAIRNELDRAHAERTAPAVNANVTASPTRLSSKTRT